YENLEKIDCKIYRYLVENVRFGEVITYQKLAEIFNIHPRHVGVIMKNNKIPLLIPCHRVIMSDGHLGRYIGTMGYIKRFLLSLEKNDKTRLIKETIFCQQGSSEKWKNIE
ncbi:MAG: MGMT family protein, partial [Planctomycetota bacterium]